MPKREQLTVINGGQVEGAEVLDGSKIACGFAEDLAAISCGPYDVWVRSLENVLGDCRSLRAREARGIQHPPIVPNSAEQRRREIERQIAELQKQLQEVQEVAA